MLYVLWYILNNLKQYEKQPVLRDITSSVPCLDIYNKKDKYLYSSNYL